MQYLYFLNLVLVYSHVFVEGHLGANYCLTVRTIIAETVWEVLRLYVFLHIGLGAVGEDVANATSLPSLSPHNVLSKVRRSLDLTEA